MKRSIPLLLLILFTSLLLAGPQKSAVDILLSTENESQYRLQARKAAAKLDLPTSLRMPGGQFIEALDVEGNQPVYVMMSDPAHPLQNARAYFYSELQQTYDLSGAELTYAYRPAKKEMSSGLKTSAVDMLLVLESTNDVVMAFDPLTGDLIDQQFMVLTGDTLATPIDINPTAWGTFTISDQLEDLVQEFDIDGNFLRTFAPAGGLNVDILNNVRGHEYHPSTGSLLVTVATGANANAIAEFDQNGATLGNFIDVGVGGLDGPFDLIFRDNDVLITSIDNDNVLSYGWDGTFNSIFTGGVGFGEQLTEMSNGDVAVANFSGTPGVLIYDAAGTFLRNLGGATGLRGVFELPNGNVMVTNGGGVHELDGQSGALIRTMVSGVSARFITLYAPTPDGPALRTTPRSLDFGDIEVGDVATDTIYAISFGTDTLQLDSTIATNAAFSVLPGSGTLASGDTLLINVNFEPDTVDNYSEYLVFYHNGPSSPDSVSIVGNGTGFPAMRLTPESLNMGMVNGGDTLTNTVNAANVGALTFSIDSVLVVGNDLFSVDQTGPINLSPSSDVDLQVTFIADTTQSVQSAQMLFYTSFSAIPDTVELIADVITGLVTGDGVKPDKFALAQNFPNPFNPVTTIDFQLPVAAKVSLEVYDITGRRVAVLVHDAALPAGSHKYTWNAATDGQSIASGVYFYRLQTDKGFSQVRKMMLLK